MFSKSKLLSVLSLSFIVATTASAAGLTKKSLPKNDDYRKLVGAIDTRWHEDNIMNDNGVELAAFELKGDLKKATLGQLAGEAIRARYEERWEKAVPANTPVKTSVDGFTEDSISDATYTISYEGFGYAKENTEGYGSLYKTMWLLARRAGMKDGNTWMAKARFKAKGDDDDTEAKNFTAYVFVNRETKVAFQVLVCEGNY